MKRLTLITILALLFLLMSSCGPLPESNEGSSGDPPEPDPDPEKKQWAAFVVTTDYATTGGFGVIELDTREPWLPDPEWAAQVTSPDPIVTSYSGYVFIINRYTHDNISVLDATDEFSLKKQYSVKKGGASSTNPHDMEFVSTDKAYLSLYELAELWVLNPLTGEKLKAIDLSSLADDDGIPEMSGMLIHDGRLYVALQLLDRDGFWLPTDKSLLAVIDTETDKLIDTIDLCGKNPITDLHWNEETGKILVGGVGKYFELSDDAGVEAVDPATGKCEFLITENQLEGEVGDFAIADSDQGYATITTMDFRSCLVRFNPQTGQRQKEPVYESGDGFVLWTMGLNDRDELYICDRTATEPGIAIIDVKNEDKLLTDEPVDVNLPPFDITFLK